jgi:uncharacterized phage-associated protein
MEPATDHIDDVAAAVLARVGPMTTMRLEKLVYYCQAWHLGWRQRPMFPEKIAAFRDGPVAPHLYRQHRLQRTVASWPTGDPARLSGDACAVVNWVLDRYGSFTAEELSELTHVEAPWWVTRGGLPADAPSTKAITLDLMARYYGRQPLSGDDAATDAVASAALEGHAFDDDFQKLLRAVARSERSADEVVAELVSARRGRG